MNIEYAWRQMQLAVLKDPLEAQIEKEHQKSLNALLQEIAENTAITAGKPEPIKS